jgi:hypothetical protein
LPFLLEREGKGQADREGCGGIEGYANRGHQQDKEQVFPGRNSSAKKARYAGGLRALRLIDENLGVAASDANDRQPAMTARSIN